MMVSLQSRKRQAVRSMMSPIYVQVCTRHSTTDNTLSCLPDLNMKGSQEKLSPQRTCSMIAGVTAPSKQLSGFAHTVEGLLPDAATGCRNDSKYANKGCSVWVLLDFLRDATCK